VIPISEEQILIQLNAKEFSDAHQSIVEENLMRLPLCFNEYSEPFIGFEHLNSLYRESYSCIIHGNYHAGIIVMSQLLEETLREIVRVHTGKSDGSVVEGLLSSMSLQSKVTSKHYLIHPELVNQISQIKEDIRHPYTHLRYKKILRGKKISAAKILVGTDPEKILENIKNSVEASKEGKLHYDEFDPSGDPVVAAVMKRDIDKGLAIQLAWRIYPLYWLLMEEYLNHEITGASLKMFGSIWEPVPPKGNKQFV
jgi:hypothetical protein